MELGGFIHRLHRLPQIILTEGPHVFPCQIGKGQVNSSRYVRSHSERKLALQRKQIAWRFQKALGWLDVYERRLDPTSARANCVEIPERLEPSSIWTSGGSGPSS